MVSSARSDAHYAFVTVDGAAGRSALADCLRDWFTMCAEELSGEWWRDVHACQPLPADFDRFRDRAHFDNAWSDPAHVAVVPGAAVAYLSFMRPITLDSSAWNEAVLTPTSWGSFLSVLGELPGTAALEFAQYDGDGSVVVRPACAAAADFSDPYRRWLTLTLKIPGELLLGSEQAQAKLRDQLRAFCARWPVTYAEVSASTSSTATAFEQLYPHRPATNSGPEWGGSSLSELARLNMERSRSWLRGYSWITAFAPEFTDRLGGVDGLVASQVFVEVEQLDNGVYWLVATDRYEEYGWVDAEKVFNVLAPALPPGIPWKPDASDPETFIVRRDASKEHPLPGESGAV